MMAAVATADRRPGRPRDARVDQQIVEATLAELADKGFGGASIESIAARAGVGKAAIYRRWPNREALLQFVALQVTDVVEPADTGDLRKDLLSVFTPLASQFYVTGAGALLPDLVAEAARDPKIRALLKDLVAERRAVAVHAFERAEARGELRRDVDVDTVVDMVGGSFLYKFMLLGEALDESTAEAAIDVALHGVLRETAR
jgi:AcrR family transcriptional regulator